jgi:5-methylcytosine-specific restriction endonuclease McrA
MSGPVFVIDAGGTPLMPMSSAYARKLLREGKAQRLAHSAFTVIQLSRRVEQPKLRPVVAALRLHLRTAELFLLTEDQQTVRPFLRVIIDLHTDLPRRLRRRAGHRRRRHARQRYHALVRHGRPFKLRRPSLLRSAWGTVMLQARTRRSMSVRRTTHATPLLIWRAQAIIRTLRALRRLMPLSHILLLDGRLNSTHHEYRPPTPVGRRGHLINAYGVRNDQGKLVPICAFCGATDGFIEVEHLRPVSRGGTEAWENLALACQNCNQCKGSQIPEEAGMHLLLYHSLRSQHRGRLRPYIDGTQRALRSGLHNSGMVLVGPSAADQSILSQDAMNDAFAACFAHPPASAPVVAYPVPRPRKQRFSSRNYPLGASPRTDQVRVDQTFKRKVRVNRGLWLNRGGRRTSLQVVPLEDAARHVDGGLLIEPGMLCAATRAGVGVTGVVSAIHTSGRLTLRTAVSATREAVVWNAVVVSPRRELRVLSTDRVVFVWPPKSIREPMREQVSDE